LDRLSVVTSEIKYIEQYFYNKLRKENKIFDFLSILFDNKKSTMLHEDTIAGKKYT